MEEWRAKECVFRVGSQSWLCGGGSIPTPHKTCYWEQWHPVKTRQFEIDGSTAVREYSKAVMPGVGFSSGIDHLSSTFERFQKSATCQAL